MFFVHVSSGVSPGRRTPIPADCGCVVRVVRFSRVSVFATINDRHDSVVMVAMVCFALARVRVHVAGFSWRSSATWFTIESFHGSAISFLFIVVFEFVEFSVFSLR